MKSVVLQLGARKRSASSRWLGLRLLIDSFPAEMLREELRNSHDGRRRRRSRTSR